MTTYAVLVSDNDGSEPVRLYSSVEKAKDAVRVFVGEVADEYAANGECPESAAEYKSRLERELSEVWGGWDVQHVLGPDCWKMSIYIAKLADEPVDSPI